MREVKEALKLHRDPRCAGCAGVRQKSLPGYLPGCFVHGIPGTGYATYFNTGSGGSVFFFFYFNTGSGGSVPPTKDRQYHRAICKGAKTIPPPIIVTPAPPGYLFLDA